MEKIEIKNGKAFTIDGVEIENFKVALHKDGIQDLPKGWSIELQKEKIKNNECVNKCASYPSECLCEMTIKQTARLVKRAGQKATILANQREPVAKILEKYYGDGKAINNCIHEIQKLFIKIIMKKPYLGWTRDQEVLNLQREYYGRIYKRWYNRLFRWLKDIYQIKNIN